MTGNDGPPPTNGIDNVYLNTLTLTGAGRGVSVTAGSIDGEPCNAIANAPAGVYGIKDVNRRRQHGLFLPDRNRRRRIGDT
jgi:hypothetical protein